MLKVTKTEITLDEFVKEVEALFPGKFTEDGLRVLFEYIEDYGDNYGCGDNREGEYHLYRISENFEEWTFEKYKDYLIETLGKLQDTKEDYNSLTKDDLKSLIYEDAGEEGADEWRESVVGFTDSTIMFTSYYTSKLTSLLRETQKRLRTISLEQFYEEFSCTSDTFMELFKCRAYTRQNKEGHLVYLIFRGVTDTLIRFEQFVLTNNPFD